MIYFHSYKNPGLVIDIVSDIRRINDISLKAKRAGMIILGGGVCKHQIANAMLFVRLKSSPSVYIALTIKTIAERSGLLGVYQYWPGVRRIGLWCTPR